MTTAIERAAFLTMILVMLGFCLWHFTLITVVLLLFGWFALMFYTDPPEEW